MQTDSGSRLVITNTALRHLIAAANTLIIDEQTSAAAPAITASIDDPAYMILHIRFNRSAERGYRQPPSTHPFDYSPFSRPRSAGTALFVAVVVRFRQFGSGHFLGIVSGRYTDLATGKRDQDTNSGANIAAHRVTYIL